MSLTSIFPSKFIFNRVPAKSAPQIAAADLRDVMFVPEPHGLETRDRVAAPQGDIADRLRALDGKAPVARNTILEAAGEIERLRGAIRAHREQVWGADTPDHMSDATLYRALDGK